jgi:hypothetical protein
MLSPETVVKKAALWWNDMVMEFRTLVANDPARCGQDKFERYRRQDNTVIAVMDMR